MAGAPSGAFRYLYSPKRLEEPRSLGAASASANRRSLALLGPLFRPGASYTSSVLRAALLPRAVAVLRQCVMLTH